MPARTNWIQSFTNLPDHPKTLESLRKLYPNGFGRLGLWGVCALFVGHLHMLWYWAMEYAENGDLTEFDKAEIERGARWTGKPGRLFEVLVSCGWLDQRDERLVLHNWSHYSGKLEVQRQRDRERKAAASGGHPKEVRETSAGHPPEIQGIPPVEERRGEEKRREESIPGAARADEGTTRKNPGTIRSDADLSHWNQGKPEPLDPETSAALEAAIGKGGGVKPIPGPEPGRREKLHRQAAGADRDE